MTASDATLHQGVLPRWPQHMKLNLRSMSLNAKAPASTAGLDVSPKVNFEHILALNRREDENPSVTAQSLLRWIGFMQDEHSKLLAALHEEVGDLKRENQALKFEMVVGHKLVPLRSTSIDSQSTSKSSNDQSCGQQQSSSNKGEVLALQSEISHLKKYNSKLCNIIENNNRYRCFELENDSIGNVQSLQYMSFPDMTERILTWSINPLRVHIPGESSSRTPTFPECERIIAHLFKKSREVAELEDPAAIPTRILSRRSSMDASEGQQSSGSQTTLTTPVMSGSTDNLTFPKIWPRPPVDSPPRTVPKSAPMRTRSYRTTKKPSSHVTLPAISSNATKTKKPT